MGDELVTLADIQAAQKLLSGIVRVTPLDDSRPLSARVGGQVYLKCENKQRTGSFKIRGAYTRIARLSAEERARGVVAASAGNHAQGVALAAQLLNIEFYNLDPRYLETYAERVNAVTICADLRHAEDTAYTKEVKSILMRR